MTTWIYWWIRVHDCFYFEFWFETETFGTTFSDTAAIVLNIMWPDSTRRKVDYLPNT